VLDEVSAAILGGVAAENDKVSGLVYEAKRRKPSPPQPFGLAVIIARLSGSRKVSEAVIGH
jgi:hypothetical protein